MYEIRWDEEALEDMKRMRLRAFDAKQIVDAVDDQLRHEPTRKTKRKKIIRPGDEMPFNHLDPVWQLRVGEFRVFYDVAAPEQGSANTERPAFQGLVSIRAVRYKPGHKTTGEIL